MATQLGSITAIAPATTAGPGLTAAGEDPPKEQTAAAREKTPTPSPAIDTKPSTLGDTLSIGGSVPSAAAYDASGRATASAATTNASGTTTLRSLTPDVVPTGGVSSWTEAQIQAMTKADVQSLTTAQISALSTTQVAWFTASQIPYFTGTQIPVFSATQLAALTTAQVSALTPLQCAYLSAQQLGALTTSQVGVLSASQLKDLSRVTVAGFTAAQTPVLSIQQLTAIGTNLGWLAKPAVQALTNAVIGSLGSVQLDLEFSQLLPSQIPALAPTSIAGAASFQFESLTSAQVAALTDAQVEALGSSALSDGLTTNASGFTSYQYSLLSSHQVSLISPYLIGGLSDATISGLSTSQINAWSTKQFAGLGQNASALTASQIGALTTSQIGSLSQIAVGALTAAQVQDFSTAQIQALSATQIAALSPSVIGALPATLLGSLPHFSSISAAAFADVSPSVLGALSTNAVGQINATQTAALSAAQVGAFTPVQVTALSPLAFSGLTTANVAGFSATTIPLLSTNQVYQIKGSALSGLSAIQVAALTPTQIAYLAPAALGAAGSSLLNALSAAQIGALTSAQAPDITPAQISALSSSQVAALTPAVLQYLSASAVGSLSPAALAGLSATQIGALVHTQDLTNAQVAAIPLGLAGSLSDSAINNLSANGASGLSPLVIATLSQSEIGSLLNVQQWTAAQTAAIPVADISALSPLAYANFSAAAVGGFSASQVAQIGIGDLAFFTNAQVAALQMGDMTGTQIASLPTASLSYLSAQQLGSLSSNAVAGFTAEQLSLLVPDQIAAIAPSAIAGLSPTSIAGLPSLEVSGLTPAQLASFDQTQIQALNVAYLDPAQVQALAPGLGASTISAGSDIDGREIPEGINDSTTVNSGSGFAVLNAAGQIVTSSTPGVQQLYTSSGAFAGLLGVDAATGDLSVWDANGKEWDLADLMSTQEFQASYAAAAGASSSDPFLSDPAAALGVLTSQESPLRSLSASSLSALQSAVTSNVVYGANGLPVNLTTLTPLGDNNGNIDGYIGMDPSDNLLTIWNTATGAVWTSADAPTPIPFNSTNLSLGSFGAANAIYENYLAGRYPSQMSIAAIENDNGQIQGYTYFTAGGDLIAFNQSGVAADISQEAMTIAEQIYTPTVITSLLNRRNLLSGSSGPYSGFWNAAPRPPASGGGNVNSNIGIEFELPGGVPITYTPFLPPGQTPPAADISKITVGPNMGSYVTAGVWADVLEFLAQQGFVQGIHAVAEKITGTVGGIIADILTSVKLSSPISFGQAAESNYNYLVSAAVGNPTLNIQQQTAYKENQAVQQYYDDGNTDGTQLFMPSTNVFQVAGSLVQSFLTGSNTPVELTALDANGYVIDSLWTVAQQIVNTDGTTLTGAQLQDKFGLDFVPTNVSLGAVTGNGTLTFGIVAGVDDGNGGGLIIFDPSNTITETSTEPLASFVVPGGKRSTGTGNI